MSVKVDLDEIERDTRAAYNGDPGYADDWAPSHAQTLALIARIRELEAALRNACAGLGLVEPHTEAEAREDAALHDRCVEILEKGAVMP